MAVRALRIVGLCAVVLLAAGSALACFGPKLYLGTGSGARQQVLASLVAIYVQEKTGIEVVRQPLDGADPSAAITGEQVDFAFATTAPEQLPVLLRAGSQLLLGGPRLQNDLQFTTVRPALQRLEQQLGEPQLAELERAVAAGAQPMETVRRFLLDAGWI